MDGIEFTKHNTSIAKGISIFIIILCHVISALTPASIGRLTTPLGGIGVFTFLFLSGFGLSESVLGKGVSSFWHRRVIGVVMPYTLAFLVSLIFKSFNSFSEFVLDFLTIRPIVTYYWYIGYIFLWYIVFYLALLIPQRYSLMRFFVLLSFSGISLFFFPELYGEQSFSFLIGVLFSHRKKLFNVIHSNKKVVLFAILGSFLLALKQIQFVRHLPPILFTLLQSGIKISYGLVVISISMFIKNSFAIYFRFIGTYSYELYLTHAIGMFFILRNVTNNSCFDFALFVIFTLVLTIILYFFSERLKTFLVK